MIIITSTIYIYLPGPLRAYEFRHDSIPKPLLLVMPSLTVSRLYGTNHRKGHFTGGSTKLWDAKNKVCFADTLALAKRMKRAKTNQLLSYQKYQRRVTISGSKSR